MRIIIDIHPLPGRYLTATGNFLTELFDELARKYVQHSFVYLLNQKSPQPDTSPENVSYHYINRIFSKWFGKKFWHRHVLPKELKKLGGDIYVTADNQYLDKSSIPSCLFLCHASELLDGTAAAKTSRRQIKSMANAIRKASQVMIFSDNDRKLIHEKSSKPDGTIKILWPSPVDEPELKWTEKELVKIDFAGGMEYFVFAGDLHERHDLIGLLKAFSLFKKWQQSNMRLVITGNKTNWTTRFTNELASFKYRNEVNVVINPSAEKLQRMIAGAYAFVYPASYDNFPVNILRAIQVGVPVISSPIKVCKEWCGNSVMYPESDDATGFAKSIQTIYKDERLRSDLIDSAQKHLSTHSRNDLLEKCMIFLEEAIAK